MSKDGIAINPKDGIAIDPYVLSSKLSACGALRAHTVIRTKSVFIAVL